jgi:hypothetical protein
MNLSMREAAAHRLEISTTYESGWQCMANTSAPKQSGAESIIETFRHLGDTTSYNKSLPWQRKGIQNVLHGEDHVLPPVEFVGHR